MGTTAHVCVEPEPQPWWRLLCSRFSLKDLSAGGRPPRGRGRRRFQLSSPATAEARPPWILGKKETVEQGLDFWRLHHANKVSQFPSHLYLCRKVFHLSER